jgi:hypothetical protein
MFGTQLQLPANNLQRKVNSLCWVGDTLVDWVMGGIRYGLDGEVADPQIQFAYRFDAALLSPSGHFAVIYERLGTKGLILYDGKILREINRSFYHADVYDYPVLLFTLPDGREALAHCPEEYNRLEIDLLETGERLTTRPETKGMDFFHSRLAVDPSGNWLISAGWIWHPFDSISLFSIPATLADPTTLDRESDFPVGSVEVTTAAFSSADLLVLTSQMDAEDLGDPEERLTDLIPGSIAVYDVRRKSYASVALLEAEAGTLMPVGMHHVVGFYEHPKLIHTASGRILHRWPDLATGKQLSSISFGVEQLPPLALDPIGRRFAVATDDGITVITLPLELPT